MHFLPDTNDEESLNERYWPDEFKQVIRQELRGALSKKIKLRSLRSLYHRHYLHCYVDLNQFYEEVINTILISAENGADEGFDIVYNAFLTETQIPDQRCYVHHFWPYVITKRMESKIMTAIVKSYTNDDGFIYAFKDGYSKIYKNYQCFINNVAGVIVSGIITGIDDKLEQLYRAFLAGAPLSITRRNPKRLKTFI